MKNKPNATITIEGTVFEVDIETQRLVEKANPSNAISFIEQMTDRGSHYDLAFDRKTRTAMERDTESHQQDFALVKIPKLIDLDPQGMADRYGYTLDQLKGKTDFEVIVDQDAWVSRCQGILPKVDIAGEIFIVDLRLQELRHAKNDHLALRLNDFDLTADGEHYTAFYHPATKKVVDPDPCTTEFPEGVIKISMPGELGLDPVATARIYGIDERDLLRRNPIPKDLKAELIPLSETGVPAMIQRNLEQLQLEHRENAKRIKPKNRPKF